MKKTRLTSSATLPGSVGGGGDFDGLCFSMHLRIHFFCKIIQNIGVTLIVFMKLVHLNSRKNRSQFVIDWLFFKWISNWESKIFRIWPAFRDTPSYTFPTKESIKMRVPYTSSENTFTQKELGFSRITKNSKNSFTFTEKKQAITFHEWKYKSYLRYLKHIHIHIHKYKHYKNVFKHFSI